jgi:hypothetical protein
VRGAGAGAGGAGRGTRGAAVASGGGGVQVGRAAVRTPDFGSIAVLAESSSEPSEPSDSEPSTDGETPLASSDGRLGRLGFLLRLPSDGEPKGTRFGRLQSTPCQPSAPTVQQKDQ